MSLSESSIEPATVVCAGIVVADHLCTPIEHLPSAGELVMAEDLVLNIGGCASNAAMDLARLGIRASVCGRVGEDAFGKFVVETLSAGGVDCRSLAIDRTRATSQTLIVNVKGQDRRFIHSFGANRGLSARDLDAALTASTRILYVGGYLILPGLEAEALAEVFRRARSQGTLTVLDVATPGPGQYLRHLRPVLPETDVFLPNTDEADLILGESDPLRQALAFRDLGAKRVVVTKGEHGAIAVSDRICVDVGTFPIEFVDGSGGGDAFDAGYIAGLLDDRDEIGCLTLASAIGASCVRAVGTTAGVFTRDEAEEFLAKHRLRVNPIQPR
ncbi:MAG: sugar kinase, ribokinase [Planctomycetota bacterium]|nr:sugar kinase, ribokinase [Planctomycetota bacterium]